MSTALATYGQFSQAQLQLIQRTIAKGTTPDEFNLFIEVCRTSGLNPIRKQVHCLIFNAKDPKKRQMVIITGIDGYRAIAARSKNYRPADARTVFDPELANEDTNPLGISHAEVSVFMHAHGEWFEYTERADWSEFAPIVEEWAEDETGTRRPTGKFRLDPKKDAWRRMGRIMLEKCAEARALRRGWPEDLSGMYVAEEMDRSQTLDLTATDIVQEAQKIERHEAIGGAAIYVDWRGDGSPIARIAVGKFGDEAIKWIREHMKKDEEEPSVVLAWRDRNRVSLQEFWAHDKDAALALKAELEKVDVFAGTPQTVIAAE